MGEPRGTIVVPIGYNPSDGLRSLELTADDFLRVYIEGGSLTIVGHNFLDGNVHPDTIARTVVEGDVIVGVDNAGVVKWQAIPAGTDGQVLTVQADGSLAWEALPTSGNWFLISDQVLVATAANIDIQNIPATYKHLVLLAMTRSNVGSVGESLLMRFNNDSGASYDSLLRTEWHNNLSATSESVGGTSGIGFICAGATAPANGFGSGRMTIFDYAATDKLKSWESTGDLIEAQSTTNIRIRNTMGHWRSTAAINRITVLPAGGGNLQIGSRLTLYGLS